MYVYLTEVFFKIMEQKYLTEVKSILLENDTGEGSEAL